MLSIVIPTDRDEENSLFKKTIDQISDYSCLELIFVGKQEAKTRAERLNIGFHRSIGNIVLFHHPRSYLDKNGIEYLLNFSKDKNPDLEWGAFTHTFDKSHYLLAFTSWYSNNIRGNIKGIFYLDHCIYFDRRLWQTDLPAVEIFEDTILSINFRRSIFPKLLPYLSTTSAIRFHKNGIWKQCILNQFLKIGFHFKLSASLMNQIYEKGLELNTTEKKIRI